MERPGVDMGHPVTRGSGYVPGGNAMPSYRNDLNELWREIRQLKLQIANMQNVDHQPLEQMFSWPGANLGDMGSGVWRAPTDITIVSITPMAGSQTDYTVDLRVEFSFTYTVSMPALLNSKIEQVRIPVPAGNYIDLQVYGIDASDFTCAVGYKRGFQQLNPGA
jgi:hypothetical protein